MEFIHVRSLEKYHPGYKDRELKYAKMFFALVQGDPEFEIIDNETDKWRFVAIICLELEAKKPLPNVDKYWVSKGFDIKKRPISLTLKMLHNFLEVDTGNSQIPLKEELKRSNGKEVLEIEKVYVDFEKSTLASWNSFCGKHPQLQQIKSITGTRRKHLKQRFESADFRDFAAILAAVESSPFLLNGNPRSKEHADWRVSFDWLIGNDTNFVKVLEGRYRDARVAPQLKPKKDCTVCGGTGRVKDMGGARCYCFS